MKQPGNVSLETRHWDMIRAYAKDQGYDGTSQSLRHILDEWQRFKAQEARDTGRRLVDSAPQYSTSETNI